MRVRPVVLALLAATTAVVAAHAPAAASSVGSLRTDARTDASAQPPDPDLEPGFPVQTYSSGGGYHGGPAINALVGNIDDDPTLEILATALAQGPLYAWNADGSIQPGWPAWGIPGAAYAGLGELSPSSPGLEIVSGHFGDHIVAYNGAGVILPGYWPRCCINYVATPPGLADVDGDGLDETFIEEEDWFLHAYSANGLGRPGWPSHCDGGQELHTPAIGDLDRDGDLEIVSASGATSLGVYLCAYHHDGRSAVAFPVLVSGNFGYADTFPAIGDVDGDGALEIVVVGYDLQDYTTRVKVFSANGTLERTMETVTDASYGTAPALGDLDGDGVPEIVVQTGGALSVFKGDGSTFPGWPQTAIGGQGHSAPVIGDVDGDMLPDIAITTMRANWPEGAVRLYNRNGVLHPHFPKVINLGFGGVPAIADIDRDGRNELVVVGNCSAGQFCDHVWAYDLHGATYGGIEWGQFGGDARHSGCYDCPPPFPPPPPPPPPADTLYDQYDHPGIRDTNSQDYEASYDEWDDEAADDFVVPAGSAWSINGLDVQGYSPQGGPANAVNVRFYANGANNLPGALVVERLTQTFTGDPSFSITISPAVTLSSGTLLGLRSG